MKVKPPSPAAIETFLASRPLLLDIETDSLRADFGLIFCVVAREYRPRGRGRVWVFQTDIRERDMEQAERAMLLKLRAFMGTRGPNPAVITYYGHRFDQPFLQTRLAMQGIAPLPRLRHLDIYFSNKRVFNPGHVVTSGRMAAVESLLKRGTPAAPMKSGVDAATWRRVKFARDRKAMRRVVVHCEVDLDVLQFQVRWLAKAGLLPQKVALR